MDETLNTTRISLLFPRWNEPIPKVYIRVINKNDVDVFAYHENEEDAFEDRIQGLLPAGRELEVETGVDYVLQVISRGGNFLPLTLNSDEPSTPRVTRFRTTEAHSE